MELKPCPFCGSVDVESYPKGERQDGEAWSVYYVTCNNCGCIGPLTPAYKYNVSSEKARNASVNLWNGRVQCQPKD